MLRSVTWLSHSCPIAYSLLLVPCPGSVWHLQSHQHNPLSDRTLNQLREPSQLQYKSMENRCVFFSDRYINLALLPKETYKKLGLPCVGLRYYCFRRLPKNTISTPELVQWQTTTLSPFSAYQLSTFLVEASFEIWRRTLNCSCCHIDTHFLLLHLLQTQKPSLAEG